MQTSVQQQPATKQVKRVNIDDAMNECIARTAEALGACGAADGSEIAAGLRLVQSALIEGKPADLIECVVRAQGHEEERLGAAIANLSDAVAAQMNPYPQVFPFASKLITPTAFYESFQDFHQLAKVLLTPVIFAEDTDAMGIASINPIASMILAEEILGSMEDRVGVKPFVTLARLDYESWAFLTRKHFAL
jgi:hypothetical protein